MSRLRNTGSALYKLAVICIAIGISRPLGGQAADYFLVIYDKHALVKDAKDIEPFKSLDMYDHPAFVEFTNGIERINASSRGALAASAHQYADKFLADYVAKRMQHSSDQVALQSITRGIERLKKAQPSDPELCKAMALGTDPLTQDEARQDAQRIVEVIRSPYVASPRDVVPSEADEFFKRVVRAEYEAIPGLTAEELADIIESGKGDPARVCEYFIVLDEQYLLMPPPEGAALVRLQFHPARPNAPSQAANP